MGLFGVYIVQHDGVYAGLSKKAGQAVLLRAEDALKAPEGALRAVGPEAAKVLGNRPKQARSTKPSRQTGKSGKSR